MDQCDRVSAILSAGAPRPRGGAKAEARKRRLKPDGEGRRGEVFSVEAFFWLTVFLSLREEEKLVIDHFKK